MFVSDRISDLDIFASAGMTKRLSFPIQSGIQKQRVLHRLRWNRFFLFQKNHLDILRSLPRLQPGEIDAGGVIGGIPTD